MRNTKNTVAVLIALIGLAILAFTYVYGVSYFKNQTESVRASNNALKSQALAYEMLYNSQAEYAKQTAEMKEEIPALQKQFVTGISTEDEIMYVSNMMYQNSKEMLTVNYLTMGQGNETVYSGAITERDPAFATGVLSMPSVSDDGVMLYSYPIDYGFNVTYQGFKDMVEYINTIGTKKQVKAVSLSFDNGTGILNGVINIDEYVMYGTDGNYEGVTIPNVALSVDNIFGTVEAPEEGEAAEPKED